MGRLIFLYQGVVFLEFLVRPGTVLIVVIVFFAIPIVTTVGRPVQERTNFGPFGAVSLNELQESLGFVVAPGASDGALLEL